MVSASSSTPLAAQVHAKRVLLIGGGGFLGSHLSTALRGLGASVTSIQRIPGPHALVADALDVDAYAAELRRANYILELVRFRGDEAAAMRDEAAFVTKLIEQRPPGVLVHFGSRLEYGTQEIPVPETAPCAPCSPYGTAKLRTELLHRHSQQRFIGLRLSTIYGGGTGIITTMIEALRKGSFTIKGDPSRYKDVLHISDLVQAVIACLVPRCEGEIINIGSGERLTFHNLATAAAHCVGGTIRTESSATTTDVSYVADITKLRRLTGWKPQVLFADGIRQYAEGGP